MTQCKWISTGCLVIVLAMTSSTARANPQDQSKPPYSFEEFKAFQAVTTEEDLQTRIKLLDGFTAKYPDSALMAYVYREYYSDYFSQPNYPQSVAYTDKFLALGDKALVNPDPRQSLEEYAAAVGRVRLDALTLRAMAYAVGCADDALRTPEASAKAKEAAEQGLDLLSQLLKLPGLTDEEFASTKAKMEMSFASAARIADARLKDEPVDCLPLPPPSPPGPAPGATFEHLIQELLNEEHQ